MKLKNKQVAKKAFAAHLRSNPTNSEIRMRKLLRRLNLRFCFQYPIGSYVADFIFVDRCLVVEVDGASHIGNEEYDARRDAALLAEGYVTLRIKDIDASENILPLVLAAFWKADKCGDTAKFIGYKIDCQ